jgi:hypothetical protein
MTFQTQCGKKFTENRNEKDVSSSNWLIIIIIIIIIIIDIMLLKIKFLVGKGRFHNM